MMDKAPLLKGVGSIKNIYGTGVMTRHAGARAAGFVFGKPIEFLGFGLFPHWDGADHWDVKMLTDLFSDDQLERSNAWKAMMGHFANGLFLGSLGAVRSGFSKAGKAKRKRDRMDWTKYYVQNAGKVKQLPRLPQGKILKGFSTEMIRAMEEQIELGTLDEASLTPASDKTIVEFVKMAADFWDKASPEVRDQLIYDMLALVSMDAKIRDTFLKHYGGPGGKQKAAENILAELRDRKIRETELQSLKADTETNLLRAVDDLASARGRFLPGMEAADADVRALTAEVERLELLKKGIEEAQKPVPPPLMQQIENLNRALLERQQDLNLKDPDTGKPISEAVDPNTGKPLVGGMASETAAAIDRLVRAGHEYIVEKLQEKKKAATKEAKDAVSDEDLGLGTFAALAAGAAVPDPAPPGRAKPDGKPGKPGKPRKPRKTSEQARAVAEALKAQRAKRASAADRANAAETALREQEGAADKDSVSKIFRDRAEEWGHNPAAAQAWLVAAQILDQFGSAKIRLAYAKAGISGIRALQVGGKGMSDAKAKIVRDLMKLQRDKKAPPPGVKAPGEPDEVTGTAAMWRRAFKAAGVTLDPNSEKALMLDIMGMELDDVLIKLRKMGVKDKDAPELIMRLGEILQIDLTGGGKSAIEEAIEAAEGQGPKAPPKEEVEELLKQYHAGKLEGPTIPGTEGMVHVGTLAAATEVQQKTGKRAPKMFETLLNLTDPARRLELIDSGRGHGSGEIAEDIVRFLKMQHEGATREEAADTEAKGWRREDVLKWWAGEGQKVIPADLNTLLGQVRTMFKQGHEQGNDARITDSALRLSKGLKKLGYDYLEYINTNEDIGKKSYVVLDPDVKTQFKDITTTVQPGEVPVTVGEQPVSKEPQKVVTPEQAKKAMLVAHNMTQTYQGHANAGVPDAVSPGEAAENRRIVAKVLRRARQNARDDDARVQLDAAARELDQQAAWYDAQAAERQMRREAAEEDPDARTDDEGNPLIGKDYTPDSIKRREAMEQALDRFQVLSNEEVVDRLQERIDDFPEMAPWMDMLRKSIEKSRDLTVDVEEGTNAPPNLRMGDRVVFRTPHGVVGGVVVREPIWEDPGGNKAPGRRVKLYSGEGKIERVRIGDILEWAPETNQDIDFSRGIKWDGSVSEGKEVTHKDLMKLVDPLPKEQVKEPRHDAANAAELRTRRGEILAQLEKGVEPEKKVTEQEMRLQARERAKRMVSLKDGDFGRLSPEDFRLEALGWLVPPKLRKMWYADIGTMGEGQRGATEEERAIGAKINLLKKAKNKQEQGKPLSKKEQEALDARDPLAMEAVRQFRQPYFVPHHVKGKIRDPEQMRLEAIKNPDSEVADDYRRYTSARLGAMIADKKRQDAMTWRDRQDGRVLLIPAAVGPDKDVALIQRRVWNANAGKFTSYGGGKPFIAAVQQADHGTWLLYELDSKKKALEWVEANIDPDARALAERKRAAAEAKGKVYKSTLGPADKLDAWLANQASLDRKMDRDGRRILNTKSASDVIGLAFKNGLDFLNRYAYGQEVSQLVRSYDYDAQGVLEAAVKANDRSVLLERLFGKHTADKVDRWLEKHPRPNTADAKALSRWEVDWDSFLRVGEDSIAYRMQDLADRGRDPISGRPLVPNENGDWGVQQKGKDNPTLSMFMGIPSFKDLRGYTGRDLVGLAPKVVGMASRPFELAYGVLQGGLADTSHGAFSALMTQPLAKLSRALIAAKSGGDDSADVVAGWSSKADHIASRHNLHMARMDEWTRTADDFVKRFRARYTPAQRLALVRAEFEGWQDGKKAPDHPMMIEFRKLMNDVADQAKALGLASDKFDERYRDSYVRLGRWKWQDPRALALAVADARKTVAEMAEEMSEWHRANDGRDVTDLELQRQGMMQRQLIAMEKKHRQLETQLKRAGRRVFRNYSAFNEVHSNPLDVVDVRSIKHWEDADRRRRITDWDKAVERGLDVAEPELLLWDSITHHMHAIETARWLKEISQDPRLAMDFRDAPKDWIALSDFDLQSNRAFRHLIGKKVSPWVYHFMKLQEGPNGTLEKIWNDVVSGVKLSFTAVAPANWALQVIANPMQVSTIAGTSLFRAYPSYLKALGDVLNPFAQGAMRKQFGKQRWLDVATDWDREFMHNLKNSNPAVTARTFMTAARDMIRSIAEKEWRNVAANGVRALGTPFRRTLQGISWVYRRLDAAARISTYRLLREQGVPEDQAVRMVNRGWDLFHQNKMADYVRKGIVQIPGTQVRIPLPLFVNSFASVPFTFLRNFAQVAGKTPLQLAELGIMVSLWNSAVQEHNGISDEEVENRIRSMTSNENDLISWIRMKTTPMTPDARGGYDLWSYHPMGAALSAMPGVESAFWGAAEGLQKDGLLGALRGAVEGHDAYGVDAWQDIIHRMAGGEHIVVSPWAEYELDRDSEGRRVQWRYEQPGQWGFKGRMKMAYETGTLPLMAVLGLGNMMNATKSSAQEAAALAGMAAQVLAELDKTDIGDHPAIEIITDGQDIWSAKPMSWQDAVMRRFGIKVRRPNKLRRIIEKIGRTKGIDTTEMGRFQASKDVAPAEVQAMRELASLGNVHKDVMSGYYLYGYLRHLQTLNPSSRAAGNILEEITRRWPTVKGRRQKINSLVKMELGREAEEGMDLLGYYNLLEPGVRDTPVAPKSPEEIRKFAGS
jgi:hypothetical protein